MRLRAAGVVASVVDTVEASAVALISAGSAAALISAGSVVALISGALEAALSAGLAPASPAVFRCRALATASMTTTTGAATATRTTQLTAAIRPPIRPRTTSREHRARYHDHAAYE